MKKIFLITGCIMMSFLGWGQTAGEWTRQKKTQIKYLLQQIAANKIYLGYLDKGYFIASKELTTIRNSKDGDFNLHRDFFGSLHTVNPTIKNSGKVAAIIAFQIKIIKVSRQSLQRVRDINQFTADEISYCSKVFETLMKDCLKNIDHLVIIIRSGELAMRDDERMKRIDKLYADMQSKYGFCSSFSDEMGLLAVQRLAEQPEINRSKLINGIP